MPVITEGKRLNDILKWEESNYYSREKGTIAAGQNLSLAAVVGKQTANGKIYQIDFTASDGTENAYGFMIADYDATTGDLEGVLIVREAIVAKDSLVFPGTATQPEKDAALSQLKAAGIIEREEA
ncbi:MAG: head decoration protein [Proteobacteria bacterium]|nr:head decoration protein [Pseudomonadota bacterium]